MKGMGRRASSVQVTLQLFVKTLERCMGVASPLGAVRTSVKLTCS